jgi:glutamate-1-semialdehyde 2,1-aminomutase
MDSRYLIYLLAGAAGAVLFHKTVQRWLLSRAKHPSLAGHVRLSKRLARLVPFYEFDQQAFFRSDGASTEVAERRRAGFERLAQDYAARFPQTRSLKSEIRSGMADLQFTDAYRVPYQYSRMVRERLGAGPLLASSSGVTLTDVDGNTFHDLAGSYGVNLLGYDFYKDCIERGAARVSALGPVLGAYHPVIAHNVRRMREISGLDEVSFHMSGTEAVMQAVRLARYQTGRSKIVRFCGAYHGWWDDVQPGLGNPARARDTFTLADMSDDSLRVLGSRRDIACVLVNPVQAMHPNRVPPADSGLVDGARSAAFDRQAYAVWLRRLRDVCRKRGIVFILDEVFSGFRLAPRGAQEYFGVEADMVTYGKTVGGGLPVGVICGRREFMRRYRDDKPADVCLARGTFNSHPYVMGTMHEFLRRLETPETMALYNSLDSIWNARAREVNDRLAEQGLPVRVVNMSTIWTVVYERPSRYSWMFQYYLRAEGILLSWIGTGRLIFSLNCTEEDFAEVAARFVRAAQAMERDGWWEPAAGKRRLGRQILLEMVSQKFRRRAFMDLAPAQPTTELPSS